jgi:hypothetical protein
MNWIIKLFRALFFFVPLIFFLCIIPVNILHDQGTINSQNSWKIERVHVNETHKGSIIVEQIFSDKVRYKFYQILDKTFSMPLVQVCYNNFDLPEMINFSSMYSSFTIDKNTYLTNKNQTNCIGLNPNIDIHEYKWIRTYTYTPSLEDAASEEIRIKAWLEKYNKRLYVELNLMNLISIFLIITFAWWAILILLIEVLERTQMCLKN